MASSDNLNVHPEGRCNLLQLGFDKTTKTIDQLVTGNYIREYSTVVEFVDSTDDTGFHASIAKKFGNFFNNMGYTMVIYRSIKVYQFIFIDINGGVTFAVSYHSEEGWSDLRSLAGHRLCTIVNPNNYCSVQLRRSGDVKILRCAGYTTKAFAQNSSFTFATVPEEEAPMYRPAAGTFFQTLPVTSSEWCGTIEYTSDDKIMFTPRGRNFPANTGININVSWI